MSVLYDEAEHGAEVSWVNIRCKYAYMSIALYTIILADMDYA